jgi:phosphoserine aminotransferase
MYDKNGGKEEMRNKVKRKSQLRYRVAGLRLPAENEIRDNPNSEISICFTFRCVG